ncbi:aldehyde dehydrogenase family protein [Porticoccaceae bacterium]|nr:aldehyde dehydrogenase family protein [Porticoccaceae bacterium]MDB9844026.1 aldehyde dehydrogenase family protein [Porticoccaceae bacterium]
MSDYKRFYIDGEWVTPAKPNDFEVINPATEEVCGTVTLGSQADVDRAVNAARLAFDTFSKTTVGERVELLERIMNVYERRINDLADAVRNEMGAPIGLASGSQVYAGLGHIAKAVKILKSYQFEERLGEHRVIKEPIGVCGLITPWNWPLNQITCKVAPALAVGCTMILKPSEIAPLSAIVFAEILAEAEVPPGVFNLVNGNGVTAGSVLSAHEDVDMISFTGSTRAGSLVTQKAAPTIKRVTLELGGKSPNLILDDADIGAAVERGVKQLYLNTGQSCNAPSRMLIPRSKLEEAEVIAARVTETFVVGDTRDKNTNMGPVVSRLQWDNIQGLIATGINEGAKLVCGGLGLPEGIDNGYYVRPTIFSNVSNNMIIAQEEIFGPVLTMIPYDTEEEGIRIANDTPYGLAAYVESDDINRARRVALSIRAGSVYLNGEPPDLDLPFGGFKRSGNGREWGVHGFSEYLEIKSIVG